MERGLVAKIVIDDIGLGMGRYLKTRRDLVTPERSPIRTVIFTLVAIAGLAFIVLALVNPDMFTGGGSARRRVGNSPVAPYITGGVLFLLGTIGAIWWSRRWRVPGGGKLRTALSKSFTNIDPNEVWAVLDNATPTNAPVLRDIVRRIQLENPQRGAFTLDVMHSPDDRLAVATVTRAILKNPQDPQSARRNQLEREAVVFRGDHYIDFKVLRDEVLKTVPVAQGGYA